MKGPGTFRRRMRATRGRALVAVSVLSLLLSPALPVWAQGDKASLANTQTESQESMRNAVYQELAKAQEKAEAGAHGEAIRLLDGLRAKQDLNSYELAHVWSLYAYVYYAQEDYSKAIDAYEKLLAQPALPQAMKTQVLYTLSQLYLITEKWRPAIDTLGKWMAAGGEAKPQTYEMLAQARYQLKEYSEAVRPAQRALEMTLAEGKQPSESLYLLLRVLYYNLKDLRQVENILQQLIRRYPKKQYWMQLVSVYGEIGDQEKQLQALELAYLQGFLDSEAQLVTLASLLLQKDLPYKAGKILQKGMEDGTISPTQKHWQLLGQAWTLAHEYEKAIPALEKAAQMSDDGQLYLILAQAHMNLGQLENAANAIRRAIDRGLSNRLGQAQLMLGQVLFDMGDLTAAKAAFQAAQSDPESRKVAAQWLTYISNEVERQAQLRAAVEQ